MKTSRIQKLSTYCLCGLLLVLPVLGYWAAQVQIGTAFVEDWLPGDDSSRATYREFVDRFGDDQILFASWPGCRLDDPRLVRFSDHLSELARTRPELAIESVQDSRTLLLQLTQEPLNLDEADARRRLQGIAIGADGSCFIAMQIADADSPARANLIASVQAAAAEIIEVTPEELILAGEPYQVHMIDVASHETMQFYVFPSALVALAFAFLCLRRLRLTVLVFALAGIGQLLGLALIAIFLGEMSAVMVVLPTLIFMLTLSAAVHLVNYYRDCGGERVASAGAKALGLGFRPCGLATLTTVFGFASLSVSQLTPVWQFGSLASVGLIVSTGILLAVFPAASCLGVSAMRSDAPYCLEPETPELAHRLAAWTQRYASWITAAGIGLLIVSLVGLSRLRTSTEFVDMFPASSPAVTSLQWVQEHLGPISSLEFIVSFPTTPTDSSTDLLARVALVEEVHRELQQSPQVASVLSAVSFLPALPSGSGTRNTIRRAVLRRTLEARQSYLQDQHLMASLPDAQLWRLSARMYDVPVDQNYREVQRDLRTRVMRRIDLSAGNVLKPASASESTRPAPSVTVTGLQSVIEKAHFALLSDLGGSFAAAFLLIAPVMMLIARGVRSGVILMIPNVLPVVLVFGTMGWLGVKLDVASILTASVALGIAVDDTLHFVVWYMRGRRAGASSTDAVSQAIAACARPMFHTTVICTGAMLPFFFSDFLPTSKFALLMVLILSGAIVGDLILLPAMLQSPLGRWVGESKIKRTQPAAATTAPTD